MYCPLKFKNKMEVEKISVSVFSNVRAKYRRWDCPILNVFETIKDGSNNYIDLKKSMKEIRAEKDLSKRQKLKACILWVFTPNGTFNERKDDKLISLSGVVCIDLDHVADLQKEKNRLKNFNYVLSIAKSPSGDGLKVFVLHDLTDPSRFADLYHYVGSALGVDNSPSFDMSCSNVSRACFYTYDSEIYVNEQAEPLHIDPNTLPNYKAPSKPLQAKGNTNLKQSSSNVCQLQDPEQIKNAIIENLEFYEEYHDIQVGNRNDSIFQIACFMKDAGVPEQYVSDYLVAYYCDAGIDVNEIKTTVNSAYLR